LEILASGENTDLSDLKPADLEWAVHRSLELHHGVAELLKHTSNDSIAPLFNPHFHPGGVVVVAHDRGLSLHETIRETDTSSELIQRGLRHTTLNTGFVDTLETEAGVHQLLSHLAIVRKNDETR
jgi:hypothetical protein